MRADPAIFGHIPGIPVGKTWDSRLACNDDAVHPGILAGIYGRKETGAFSVVLSGGYEDDVDKGDSFTYTGCGGRDLTAGLMGEKRRRVGPQACDQTFDNDKNRALQVSSFTKNPVRVVRGFKLHSVFAPAEGYRYDGLYRVVRAWRETGKAGYLVCRYEFQRLPGQPSIPRLEYKVNTNHIRKVKASASASAGASASTSVSAGASTSASARPSASASAGPKSRLLRARRSNKEYIKRPATASMSNSTHRPTYTLNSARPVQFIQYNSSRSNAQAGPSSFFSPSRPAQRLRPRPSSPRLGYPPSPPASSAQEDHQRRTLPSSRSPPIPSERNAGAGQRASSSRTSSLEQEEDEPIKMEELDRQPPAWKVDKRSSKRKDSPMEDVKGEED